MKLFVYESPIPFIREAVRECFASDPELLSKWHIVAPGSLDECVNRTMKDVTDFDPSFKFYPVFVKCDLAGYFGTECGNYINLIFIKPDYRCKKFVTKFLKEICDRMPDVFYTAVYSKNTPAVAFYAKLANVVTPFTVQNHPAIHFRFRKDSLCP